MANICGTTVAFFATSDKYTDKLVDFHDTLTSYMKEVVHFDSIYIANKFNIDTCTIEYSYVYDIEDISSYGIKGFKLWQDDKWTSNLGLWNAIIEQYYTTDDGERMIDYVYEAEECGCGIYINTDIDGNFFSDLYKVDAILPVEIYDTEFFTEYFSSTSDVLDALDELVQKIPDHGVLWKIEEYTDCINRYLRDNYPDSDYYFEVHEFKEE